MNHSRHPQFAATVFLLLGCFTSVGCIGGLAQLFYVIKGHDVPAAYPAFNGKRVAIVVNTEYSSNGSDSLADSIERYIALKLTTNGSKISVVPNIEIDNWIDVNGLDPNAYAELGKAVRADYLLTIDVNEYSIREGSTIYKGKSEVSLAVIEVKTGNTTYTKGPDYLVYPENGRPAIQTDERKFETFYLAWLTEQIAKQFYKHDGMQQIAQDAALLR